MAVCFTVSGERPHIETLETVAEWIGQHGKPVDAARHLFGPQCIRVVDRGYDPGVLVFDNGWSVVLRRDSALTMRYALARSLARWALLKKLGPATATREAEVNYVGLALFAPRKVFVPDARELALREVAAKYGLDETAVLCRMSELLPRPTVIVFDDRQPFPNDWPGVDSGPSDVVIRGPWERSRDVSELRAWAKEPPKGLKAIRLSDRPRTALVETG